MFAYNLVLLGDYLKGAHRSPFNIIHNLGPYSSSGFGTGCLWKRGGVQLTFSRGQPCCRAWMAMGSWQKPLSSFRLISSSSRSGQHPLWEEMVWVWNYNALLKYLPYPSYLIFVVLK